MSLLSHAIDHAVSLPGPVRNLQVLPYGVLRLIVYWTPPLQDGGTAITGYTLIITSNNGTISRTDAEFINTRLNVVGLSCICISGGDFAESEGY